MARIAFFVVRLNFELHAFEAEAFITSGNQIAMRMGGDEDRESFLFLFADVIIDFWSGCFSFVFKNLYFRYFVSGILMCQNLGHLLQNEWPGF